MITKKWGPLWHNRFVVVVDPIKLYLTLCNTMDCSTPGSSVLHYLSEFAVFMSLEPVILSNHFIFCHSFPSAFNLSQNQGLFLWGGSLNQVVKVMEFSFSISPSNECPGLVSLILTALILQSKGCSRVFSSTKFESINSSDLSLVYGPTLTSIHGY